MASSPPWTWDTRRIRRQLRAARQFYQEAQLLTDTWGALPTKLTDIRATYAAEIGNYFQVQHAAGQRTLPAPVDLNGARIISEVKRLMPPDFNTGWRAPIWCLTGKIAFFLTGRGPDRKDFNDEWFNAALSAYRVGSAYWLLILYQTALIIAGLVGLIALGFHS